MSAGHEIKSTTACFMLRCRRDGSLVLALAWGRAAGIRQSTLNLTARHAKCAHQPGDGAGHTVGGHVRIVACDYRCPCLRTQCHVRLRVVMDLACMPMTT